MLQHLLLVNVIMIIMIVLPACQPASLPACLPVYLTVKSLANLKVTYCKCAPASSSSSSSSTSFHLLPGRDNNVWSLAACRTQHAPKVARSVSWLEMTPTPAPMPTRISSEALALDGACLQMFALPNELLTCCAPNYRPHVPTNISIHFLETRLIELSTFASSWRTSVFCDQVNGAN